MGYQHIGEHVDGGGPVEHFDLVGVAAAPDLAVAVHAALGQAGTIAAQVDTAQPRILIEPPGAPGWVYRCSGRVNHSALTRRFFGQVVNVPAGQSAVPHGLGVVPDMYYGQIATRAVISPWNLYGVDDQDLFIENHGLAFDLALYAWQLHSIDSPIATSGPLDVSLIAGAAPVQVPHGLGRTPDLILPCQWQTPPGGLAPAGRPVITGLDETNITISSGAAAGNPLPLRIFAQRTHSIQR